MPARWVIIALAIGMYLAWRDQNTIAGYLTVIGCTIAYGLRKIEWKLMAIERELSKIERRGVGRIGQDWGRQQPAYFPGLSRPARAG